MTHDAAAWLHDVVIIGSMYICRVHKVANIYIYISYMTWKIQSFTGSMNHHRCRPLSSSSSTPSAQDVVEAARREAAHKACRALASPFHDLLGGFPAELNRKLGRVVV